MKSRIESLIEYFHDDPLDNFTIYALALEYIKLYDFETALEYFLKLKALNPEYLPMYYHLGKLYETLKDNDLAAQTYIEGMRIAEKQKDKHTYAELKEAYTSFMAIDDEDW
ncbi:MAG: tetratricopeptide repeat protein [Bacteroidia bacterium]